MQKKKKDNDIRQRQRMHHQSYQQSKSYSSESSSSISLSSEEESSYQRQRQRLSNMKPIRACLSSEIKTSQKKKDRTISGNEKEDVIQHIKKQLRQIEARMDSLQSNQNDSDSDNTDEDEEDGDIGGGEQDEFNRNNNPMNYPLNHQDFYQKQEKEEYKKSSKSSKQQLIDQFSQLMSITKQLNSQLHTCLVQYVPQPIQLTKLLYSSHADLLLHRLLQAILLYLKQDSEQEFTDHQKETKYFQQSQQKNPKNQQESKLFSTGQSSFEHATKAIAASAMRRATASNVMPKGNNSSCYQLGYGYLQNNNQSQFLKAGNISCTLNKNNLSLNSPQLTQQVQFPRQQLVLNQSQLLQQQTQQSGTFSVSSPCLQRDFLQRHYSDNFIREQQKILNRNINLHGNRSMQPYLYFGFQQYQKQNQFQREYFSVPNKVGATLENQEQAREKRSNIDPPRNSINLRMQTSQNSSSFENVSNTQKGINPQASLNYIESNEGFDQQDEVENQDTYNQKSSSYGMDSSVDDEKGNENTQDKQQELEDTEANKLTENNFNQQRNHQEILPFNPSIPHFCYYEQENSRKQTKTDEINIEQQRISTGSEKESIRTQSSQYSSSDSSVDLDSNANQIDDYGEENKNKRSSKDSNLQPRMGNRNETTHDQLHNYIPSLTQHFSPKKPFLSEHNHSFQLNLLPGLSQNKPNGSNNINNSTIHIDSSTSQRINSIHNNQSNLLLSSNLSNQFMNQNHSITFQYFPKSQDTHRANSNQDLTSSPEQLSFLPLLTQSQQHAATLTHSPEILSPGFPPNRQLKKGFSSPNFMVRSSGYPSSSAGKQSHQQYHSLIIDQITPPFQENANDSRDIYFSEPDMLQALHTQTESVFASVAGEQKEKQNSKIINKQTDNLKKTQSIKYLQRCKEEIINLCESQQVAGQKVDEPIQHWDTIQRSNTERSENINTNTMHRSARHGNRMYESAPFRKRQLSDAQESIVVLSPRNCFTTAVESLEQQRLASPEENQV